MGKILSSLGFAFVLGLYSATSVAQFSVPDAHTRQALRIGIGYQGRYMRTELAYETPTLWQTSLFAHPMDIKLEASFAYWHTNHSHDLWVNSRSNIWQIGITPMFRWWITPQWYAEAGVGATMVSHTRFANRELSTQFQFGDHIGIVRTFGDDLRIGLRLSHFSNASIKRPNNGLNLIQLTMTYSF